METLRRKGMDLLLLGLLLLFVALTLGLIAYSDRLMGEK